MRPQNPRPAFVALTVVLVLPALVGWGAAAAGHATNGGRQVSRLQVVTPKIPIVVATPSASDATGRTIAQGRFRFQLPPVSSLPQGGRASSWNERRRLLLGSQISVPPAPPREFQLSVRQPFVAGAGEVRLVNATLVSPSANTAFLPACPSDGDRPCGVAWIRFQAEAGQRYLVDALVSSPSSPFTLAVGGDASCLLSVGPTGSAMVVIDSSGAGLLSLYLGADAKWSFHTVTVSVIPRG